MRKAKILATLGPASRGPALIEALLAAGANAVRINMSHGMQEEHAETIRRARAAADRMKRPLAVLVDLSGPKIRTGVLRGGQPVTLEAGALFTLTTRSVAGDAHEVSTNYAGLARDVRPGARILLDDGAIELHIALSFVRRAEDCQEAKAAIKAAGGKQPLVAKIEKSEAMDHLDEIIKASDG